MVKKEEIEYKNVAAKVMTYERLAKYGKQGDSKDDVLRRLLDAADVITDELSGMTTHQKCLEARRILTP